MITCGTFEKHANLQSTTQVFLGQNHLFGKLHQNAGVGGFVLELSNHSTSGIAVIRGIAPFSPKLLNVVSDFLPAPGN